MKLAEHRETCEKVAIKILEKDRITSSNNLKRIRNEIEILRKLKHRNIAKIYQVLENTKFIYIVMENCIGGDLNSYISKKKRLDEFEAIRFFGKILDAVEYMHTQKIAHRDLKLENLMLGEDKVLKIIDFGLSKQYEGLLSSSCGTPCYSAPEMLRGEQYDGLQIDIWGAGVILFVLVCGYLPFEVIK